MKKVILITGCSSGIGFYLARELSKDNLVVATSRKDIPLLNKNIIKMRLDVTKSPQIKKCFKEIIKKTGQIDVIINNAGYGLIGPLENISLKDAKNQFDTNFFGPLRVIKQAIPLFKKQKFGTIINVSSIAGIIGSRNMSLYCSSKFALEGLSESLYEELKPFNIKVKLIEFGYVKETSFGKNTIKKNYVKSSDISSKKVREETPLLQVIETLKEMTNDSTNKFRYIAGDYGKKRIYEKIKDSPENFYLS